LAKPLVSRKGPGADVYLSNGHSSSSGPKF